MHNTFFKLAKQLSKPSRVASTLDWKKVNGSTVLSLNIHRDRIGIAVASHPSFGQKCHELEPLRFADDHITIDSGCLDRFQQIIEDYKVCGIVVSWPLQHDTGRMGAACGRVLYALEEIIDKSGADNSVLSPNRPLCLWDSEHIIPKQKQDPKRSVDTFGRCASYCQTSQQDEYRASKSQYHEDENTVVVKVWEDFCQEHWPELFRDDVNELSPRVNSLVQNPYGTSIRSRDHKSSRAEPQAHISTIPLLDVASKKRSLIQNVR